MTNWKSRSALTGPSIHIEFDQKEEIFASQIYAKGMGYEFTIMCFSLNFIFLYQKKISQVRAKRGETFFVIKQTFQSLHKVHTKPSFHTHIIRFQLIIFLAVLYSFSTAYAVGKKRDRVK